MPDDARNDRFRPPAPETDGPSGQAPGGSGLTLPVDEPFAAAPMVLPAAPPAATWDEWSHLDRDRRERAALVTSIRGDRGTQGLLHVQAVTAYRGRLRTAVIVTITTMLPVGFLWFRMISARDAALAQGYGAQGLAPWGFVLLALTVLAALALLRLWRSVYRARVDPLRFAPLPDSPEAPRHGAFDGSTPPPVRW